LPLISAEAKNRYRDAIIRVEGTRDRQSELFLFTISTCIWCKMGKRWLNDRGYAYSYLEIDKIPVDEKNEIKKELAKLAGDTPSFPFLFIDDEKWHSGYVPFTWEELLDEV
jgi:glutaredoxin